ncbi:hypothetical protein PA598K_01985 [Paenibacillus sp. 598K]|uniref:helix-turn-helix transcriptional regulator n=1 Tax=Paenibacillus sp. 598K TaxID=1117987 RepID=UPI000FF937C9|nr:helix-turn-helix transcriptional regulator [Paenibacillus sp. 598K]GBF73677.1 hypothetical protein PA598K_01985 [Paenibacillus sp. 598K]
MLDNQRVGRNILSLRRGRAWTQVELAGRVGVSHQAVSKWEQGECLPDLDVLLQLSRMFDTSMESILLDEEAAAIPVAAPLAAPAPSRPADQRAEQSSSLWAQALEALRRRVSGLSFDTWLKGTSATYDDGVCLVYSPNAFSAEWLRHRYTPLIIEVLEALTGERGIEVRCLVGPPPKERIV